MDAKNISKRTTLRLPQPLYDRIEAATAGKTSLNALIIEALEEKYPTPVVVDLPEAMLSITKAFLYGSTEQRLELSKALTNLRRDQDPESELSQLTIQVVNMLNLIASAADEDPELRKSVEQFSSNDLREILIGSGMPTRIGDIPSADD